MAGSKRFTPYITGTFLPGLKNVEHAVERPFLGPQDQQRTLNFPVQVGGIVRQIDGGSGAVIFTQSAYRGWVAKAAQIIVLRGTPYPLGNVRARLFPAQAEQHRFEEKLGAICKHGLRERRRLDKHEPMEKGGGEFLGDCLIALVGGHDVQDNELSEPVRVVQGHTVSDATSAIMSHHSKLPKSQLLHDLHLILSHGSLGIGEMIRAPGGLLLSP